MIETQNKFSTKQLTKMKTKIKYTAVTKSSYETSTTSIEFKVEINGKTATGYWRPVGQYVTSGVDVNDLRISQYNSISIFTGGGTFRTYDISGRLEVSEKQPRDLRFTGRRMTINNLKTVFVDKIKKALENPDAEPKLSKEFLEYFQINN